MPRPTHARSKLSAIVCAISFAVAVSASAKDDETRTCKTTFGGQVVCGNLTIGITLEQYEAGLKKRAEEIRGEEAEKRVQLQKLVEMTERATSAEKDSLRSQIATVEVEKRARSPRPVSWPRSGSTGVRLMLTMLAPRGCSQATGSTPSVPEIWRSGWATTLSPPLSAKRR